MAAAAAPRPAHATRCPVAPLEIPAARFALAPVLATPPDENVLAPLTLPDQWRARRSDASGFAWYRLELDLPDGGGDERCGVLLPDVNMNAAVFVNGNWIGDGGSFAEPVVHNFNRPLYFQFPPALLRPGKNEIDVLLFAYAHHFGRLAPVWSGRTRR